MKWEDLERERRSPGLNLVSWWRGGAGEKGVQWEEAGTGRRPRSCRVVILAFFTDFDRVTIVVFLLKSALKKYTCVFQGQIYQPSYC